MATSARAEELEGLLQVAGASRLIDDASSSADAERSKPDPDIVHAALEKAGCRPDEAIFIGDTPYDIAAGNHLGVPVIALRCGGWWTDRSFHGAVAIYDDPDDLVENYLLVALQAASRLVEIAADRFEARPLCSSAAPPTGRPSSRSRAGTVSDGECLAVDAVVHLLPGERRRDAGEFAGARAVGGRERLPEDVLQEVDVDALAARARRCARSSRASDASARRPSR